MYAVAVVQPRRVTVGPTEYHDFADKTTIKPPPYYVSLLE
jgi:hypothetical protein